MNKQYKKFLDNIRIYAKGGVGGNGYPKFGGVGGNGGNVVLKVDDKATFKKLLHRHPRKRLEAAHGVHSHKHRLLGDFGKDLNVYVPPGVSVINDHGHIVGELNAPKDSLVIAHGGAGGNINNGFIGEVGEENHFRLDLKLIADIGLVGFPNAGKSTILKRLSRCKVKIASYPFTTLSPSVGNVVYDDLRQISIADLPGLIEGSHANVGMGHRFLKHVQRTRMIILCVDIMGFQLKPQDEARSAIENVYLLNKELELYDEHLISKPCLLVVNKMDLPESQYLFEAFLECIEKYENFDMNESLRPKEYLKFDEIIPISAKCKPKTIHYLKERIRYWCDVHDDRGLDSKCLENIQLNLKEHSRPIM